MRRNSGFEAIFAREKSFNKNLMYLAVFIIVVLSGVALFLFQYMNQKRKLRQEEMHERKKQQFEELLKLISNKNAEVSGTDKPGQTATEPDKNSENL